MFVPHFEQYRQSSRSAPPTYERAPPRQIINGKLRLALRPLKRFVGTNGRYSAPVASGPRIQGQKEACNRLFVAACPILGVTRENRGCPGSEFTQSARALVRAREW